MSIADSFGCSPICDRRSIEEQPLANAQVASSRAEIAVRRRRETGLKLDMTYSDLAGACGRRACGIWAWAIWAGLAGWTRLCASAAAAGLGAAALVTDADLEAIRQNVKTASQPSKLQITDLRFATLVGAPMTCPIIRIDTKSIRAAGRSTQGVKLLNLDADDKVAAAVIIPPEEAKTLPEEGTLLQ